MPTDHHIRAAARQRRFAPPSWALILVLAMTTIVAAFVLAHRALQLSPPLEPADAIIVLGGDGPPRAAMAASLYKDGLAPRILISGDGDCLGIREMLVRAGVPAATITTECLSRNTWENATFSAPILSGWRTRTALLVTSWFHTRRAVACFRHAAPNLEIRPVGAKQEEPIWTTILGTDGRRVLAEYVKIGWYAVHYGIRP